MRRLRFSLFLILACTSSMYVRDCLAQSGSTSAKSEQVMNELLNEVKQLRLDLRRMQSNTLRAQTILERLRLEQEQLTRVTVELNRVRTQLSSLKASRTESKEKLDDLQKKVEAGVVNPTEANAIKATLGEMDQREPELVTRESQLVAELTIQQGKVEELNKRLDILEQEMLTISRSDEERPVKKN